MIMQDKRLGELAAKYGTPLYVFDKDEVKGRAEEIRRIMNENLTGDGINLCYSIKANPFLIPLLVDTVDRFEVCSPGELSICMHYEVPPEMIIYSGVHKEISDITEAVRYGAGVLTAESRRHYDLICSVADELKTDVKVILRLASGSQFGMSREDIEAILKEGADPRVEITGLHYFVGTQRMKLKHQRDELGKLKEIFAELRERYGLPLKAFEYGPGLGFPYFEGDDFSDTLRPVKELAEDLKEVSGWSVLTVEMGRFIASSCGYYLTKVVDIKKSEGRNWCIVDGGINHVNYLGQMMGLKIPLIRHLRDTQEVAADKGEAWAICGSLCTTNDVLVREYAAGDLKIGDTLVLCNIGAYAVTEAMNLFLSRDMPRIIVAQDGGEDRLIRDITETWKLNSGTLQTGIQEE